MRYLAVSLLLIMMPTLALGVDLVPRHDGNPALFVVAVLLPTLAIGWSIAVLLPKRVK